MNKVYTPGANILAEEDFTKLIIGDFAKSFFHLCKNFFAARPACNTF